MVKRGGASFSFCLGIATNLVRPNKDPPTSRTRVGQKGRLLPHEAPFPLLFQRWMKVHKAGFSPLARSPRCAARV